MSLSFDQEFNNREEWRLWLEKNHSSKKEVWLIIQKKKSRIKGLKYQEALEEAICFGWIDSKMQSIDTEKFRQRFSPRKKNSYWSKKNKETAERLSREGKMKEAGLLTIDSAKQSGKWEAAYSSKIAPKIPTDLEKALKKNLLAWTNFNKFSNSIRFQYVYWIDNAKKDETRKRRIINVVKKASQNIKPS